MLLAGPPNWAMGAPTPFNGPCGPSPCISLDQGIVGIVIIGIILAIYSYLIKEKDEEY